MDFLMALVLILLNAEFGSIILLIFEQMDEFM